MKGGLRQQRRAEFPKGKQVARSRIVYSSVVYDNILEGKLKKGS